MVAAATVGHPSLDRPLPAVGRGNLAPWCSVAGLTNLGYRRGMSGLTNLGGEWEVLHYINLVRKSAAADRLIWERHSAAAGEENYKPLLDYLGAAAWVAHLLRAAPAEVAVN